MDPVLLGRSTWRRRTDEQVKVGTGKDRGKGMRLGGEVYTELNSLLADTYNTMVSSTQHTRERGQGSCLTHENKYPLRRLLLLVERCCPLVCANSGHEPCSNI